MVGVINKEIVATAGICFYQLPCTFSNPSGKIAYITNIYTDDAYRRKGIATYLLDQLINEARALNYKTVRLHASVHGKGIYKSAGFTDADGFMDMML
jgi:ribosomal protein S18 acetylase RimI-like enzyme